MIENTITARIAELDRLIGLLRLAWSNLELEATKRDDEGWVINADAVADELGRLIKHPDYGGPLFTERPDANILSVLGCADTYDSEIHKYYTDLEDDMRRRLQMSDQEALEWITRIQQRSGEHYYKAHEQALKAEKQCLERRLDNLRKRRGETI